MVLALVAADILFILAELRQWLPPEDLRSLHGVALSVVFLAAVLPAIVASLNGIRFQSECRRLAERSAVIRTILQGRVRHPASLPPAGVWRSFVAWLGRRRAGFRRLLPWLSRMEPGHVPDPTGSKLAGADRLISRIATATSNPATDPASWTPEVLRFAESVADVFVQEVAEWSVLYAKEVAEP
jgi:hypothetical protein